MRDRAGGREQVLALVRAPLAAPEADPALGRARHEDVVALADARDTGSRVLDHADRGVPDDRRQGAGQPAHAALVEAVRVAVRAGGHADDDVVVLGRHRRDVLDLERPAVFDEECGLHVAGRCHTARAPRGWPRGFRSLPGSPASAQALWWLSGSGLKSCPQGQLDHAPYAPFVDHRGERRYGARPRSRGGPRATLDLLGSNERVGNDPSLLPKLSAALHPCRRGIPRGLPG